MMVVKGWIKVYGMKTKPSQDKRCNYLPVEEAAGAVIKICSETLKAVGDRTQQEGKMVVH